MKSHSVNVVRNWNPGWPAAGSFAVLFMFALAAAALGQLSASGQTTAAAGGLCEWTIVDSPSPAFDGLNAIEAVSADDIWAAGTTQQLSGSPVQPLAEHWDGTTWSVVPSLSLSGPSGFFDLSAVSTDDVWAVGQFNPGSTQTLFAHWDGGSWTRVPSPNPGPYSNNFVYGIDIISSTDGWAVGASADPAGAPATALAFHWDGVSWTSVPAPATAGGSSLVRVTAIASDDVWAVGAIRSGSASAALITHWDGSTWTVVPSPTVPGYHYLSDITAISSSDIWASGVYVAADGSVQMLFEHWDGVAWNVVPSPTTSSRFNILIGIAAGSPSDVWAVGWSAVNESSVPRHTLTAHWDGSAWAVMPSPDGGESSMLEDVIAGAPAGVWAVGGGYDSSTNTARTLIERCVEPAIPPPTCPPDGHSDNSNNDHSGGQSICGCVLDDNDFDDDGISNLLDLDDDNDGINDAGDSDDDNDGVGDHRDPDDDNDGIPDARDLNDGQVRCRNEGD
jgi:hypothetical protein